MGLKVLVPKDIRSVRVNPEGFSRKHRDKGQ